MLRFARERILARQGSFMTTPRRARHHVRRRRRGRLRWRPADRDDQPLRLRRPGDAPRKDGDFWIHNSQRWNANNSAVWPDRELDQERSPGSSSIWSPPAPASRASSTGVPRSRSKPARRKPAEFGTNPAARSSLRPYQFCNLSSAVARSDDTFETLTEKVEVATIIGTIQSMAVDFPACGPSGAITAPRNDCSASISTASSTASPPRTRRTSGGCATW